MTIESFIQSHLEARLQKNKALLIYDVESLYSGIADKMEQGSVAVVRAVRGGRGCACITIERRRCGFD